MRKSIFQQIVLPYLAYRPLASPALSNRLFSSSIARYRAAANTDSSTSIPPGPSRRWDYVPPITPLPYNSGHDPPHAGSRASISPNRRLAPAIQPIHHGQSQRRGGGAGEVLAFLKGIEETKGNRQATLLMALEKIASIPDHLVERETAEQERSVQKPERAEPTGPRKGRIRAEDGSTATKLNQPTPQEVEPHSPPMPVVIPTTEPEKVGEGTISTETQNLRETLAERLIPSKFPLIIYSLLRTRLYRLTVYHLLLTPAYAVDQPLLDRVAEYMKLDGAGKLARRLEKGWDGTLPSSPAGVADSDTEVWDDDVPLPQRTPFGSPAIRRPPDAWLLSRRAAAYPIPVDPTLAALTANYNSHLTRALLSPKKGSSSSSNQTSRNHSSNPLTPLNNILTVTRPLQRPSGGMRQLRQLIQKIERLEKHRSFRPDWVTANLVVKCWMNCLMSGGSGWRAGAGGKRNGGQPLEAEIDRRAELKGLFGFVRALFEKGLEDQATWEKHEAENGRTGSSASTESTPMSLNPKNAPSIESPVPLIRSPPYPYPQAISFARHVRPFTNDLIRALKQIGDLHAVGSVIEWQREMRERMDREPFRLKEAGRGDARQGGRRGNSQTVRE